MDAADNKQAPYQLYSKIEQKFLPFYSYGENKD